MDKRPVTAQQLDTAITRHVETHVNESISASWDRETILQRGWFGYRESGPSNIIAYSYHRKRTRWYLCRGYSA